MHNEAIPKCVTNDIIPATEKPAQFKYSVFDKNCRKATIPNNGIDDDKKSINGANPIKLLTFNPLTATESVATLTVFVIFSPSLVNVIVVVPFFMFCKLVT